MADPALHGNGRPCPACALRRDRLRARGAINQVVTCNHCEGRGRVPLPVAEIVAAEVARARRDYWPILERRWGAGA